MIKQGYIIQASFFGYVLAQAFLGPFITGVNVYGEFVVAFAPVLLLAGFFEPIVQKMVLSFEMNGRATVFGITLQFRYFFIFFYAAGCFFLQVWAFIIEWKAGWLLITSFLLYCLNILHVTLLYKERDLRKIAFANTSCLISYLFGLGVVYFFPGHPELLVICFIFSQVASIVVSFKRSLYSFERASINGSFYEVCISALSWRLPYLAYYPAFFVLLSLVRDVEYTGAMKIIFSALSSLRFLYPVTIPAFLLLVSDKKYNQVYFHLARMIVLFFVCSLGFFIFKVHFYSVFSIDAAAVDSWIFIVVPIYLVVPVAMCLAEECLGALTNLTIALAFSFGLAFMLLFLDFPPFLSLFIVVSSHTALVLFLRQKKRTIV